MRFPNYLTCTPSGVYLFRIRVPADLRGIIGRDFIKQRIGRDLLTARRAALDLSARYALAFDAIRGRGMTKDKTAEEVIRSVAENGKRDYVITTPNGIRIEAHDAADHARAMEAVERIGYIGPVASQPAPAVPVVDEAIALGKGRDAWIKSLQANTLPKTLTIKKTAADALVSYLGASRAMHTITRADFARFFQHLRDGGLSTPTLRNKQSYIGGEHGFIAWAAASGHYPRFAKDANPAAGHVSYPTREKRQRLKLGFRPFDLEQVRALYAPDAFAKLSPGARWAALLGLYTGARASEVGQLLIADIVDADGTPALRISDEGEDQKLKTAASLRTVPLHPDLLSLGFLDYIERLRGEAWRVFPQADPRAKNGAGNWISKAFSLHVARTGKDWPEGKRGFHSLRKTVVQQMQAAGVPSEVRAQLVGHDLDDEHHATYSRRFTAAELLPWLSRLAYGLDLDALRPLLTASVSKRTAKAPGRNPAPTAAARKRASKSGGK